MPPKRQRLAGRRQGQGHTQTSLAALLQVHRSTVSRWEQGETEPQPYIRPKLAGLLRVSGEELAALLRVDAEPDQDP
jgi:transcriptional regulator with XRE-family HTH domain